MKTPLKETGRQRVLGIPLDYHKRLDSLERTKLLLGFVALIAAGGWATYAAMRPARSYSPGPVAAVHATWETQCAACHLPFTPLQKDAVNLSGAPAHAANAKCQACHLGPPHHQVEKSSDQVGCSVCHREHRGRDAPIARTPNLECTRCHANLAEHTQRPELVVASGPYSFAHVNEFNLSEHPRFRVEDPGKLKFSHRRHLVPGLNLGAKDRLPAMLLSKLPSHEDRDRYRADGQTDDEPVRLTCGACHQLDADDLKSTARAASSRPPSLPGSTGAYMLPINYENHCRACHPLNYAPTSSSLEPTELIPHGLSPSEISRLLRAAYAETYLVRLETFAPPAPQRPLPGGASSAGPLEAKEAIETNVNIANTFLRGRCLQCHDLAGSPSAASVTPTRVPDVWFDKARFDHSAHRAVECRVCHEQTYLYEPWQANAQPPGLDNQDVLLPTLSVCVKCHGPRRADGTGGARFDCVECHRYHGGDHPRAGRGAAQRGASHRWPLEEFLRGEEPEQAP